MKKVVLSLALIGALTVVSCDKKVDQKVESETEISADTLEQNQDSTNTEKDSTVEKTGEAVKEEASKAKAETPAAPEKVAKETKEAVKK